MLTNLGNALRDQMDLDQAVATYEGTLHLQPNYVAAHKALALIRLLSGDFARGWPEYEWRFQDPEFPRRSFRQPRWEGQPLPGRTILLHAEQGLGDTIQFIRYAAPVKQRGNRAGGMPARAAAAPGGMPRHRSAGRPGRRAAAGRFSRSLAQSAARPQHHGGEHPGRSAIPVCRAARQAFWSEKLAAPGGFKIGIAWQGRPEYRDDRFRSIPLAEFAPLARVPGVRLVNLQKGPGQEQLPAVRGLFPVTDFSAEMDTSGDAFLDTAAVMTRLDLVVSSDTATAHLAGASGVPVWLALRRVPDWRWFLGRCDSPWYPTMRLFRQPGDGDWSSVFTAMEAALCARLAASGSGKEVEHAA